MQTLARYLVDNLSESGGQVWVVDPRFTNAAGKAEGWTPIKTGTDAAFGLGLIRWLIDNNGVDNAFLLNPNKTASAPYSFTDATWIVKYDGSGNPLGYFLDSDAGVGVADVPVVWNGSAYEAYTVSAIALPLGSLDYENLTEAANGGNPCSYRFQGIKGSRLYKNRG